MFCTNCGNKLSENIRFCTSCGKEVKNFVAIAVSPPAEIKPSEIKVEEKEIPPPVQSIPTPAPIAEKKETIVQNRPIPGELLTLIMNYAAKGELAEQETRILKNEANYSGIEWSRVQSIIDIEQNKVLQKKKEEKKKQKRTKVRRIISNSIFVLILLSIVSLMGLYVYAKVYQDKDYFWIIWEWVEDKAGTEKQPEVTVPVTYNYNSHGNFVLFWNDLKTAVIKGDSQAVYMMTKIPLEDRRGDTLNNLTCNNPTEFYSNFRRIFNPQTIEAIRNNKFRSWRSQPNGEDKILKDEYLLEVSSLRGGINIAFVKAGGMFRVGYLPSDTNSLKIKSGTQKIISTQETGSISNSENINMGMPTTLTIVGSKVRIRQTQGVNSAIVTELNTGDVCTIIEKGTRETIGNDTDFWYKVKYIPYEGWVFGHFTSLKL